MLHELGPSIRGLVRAPAHSAIVVLTMALGIGATATIASVVNGVLLRPLPFRNAERLMMLWQRAPGVGVEEDWLSPAQYFDLREKVRGFEELAMVFGTNVTLTGDGVEPERLG
ncbi:MAG TPA: ABC transporter permease, partial [Vicinamibacteria bacterium]